MKLLGISPSYKDFYALFHQAGENADRAAGLLLDLMREWPDERPGLRQEIVDCEHEGDRLTHDVIHHIATRAAVPVDQSDAHRLASELDDVVDYVEEVAGFMVLYRVEAPTDYAVQLAQVLDQAAAEIATALASMDDMSTLHRHITAVDRLEDEGDRLEREAVRSLFDGGIDPMVVIRWKDVYQRMEEAIDSCAHVANVLQGISVKHA